MDKTEACFLVLSRAIANQWGVYQVKSQFLFDPVFISRLIMLLAWLLTSD